MDVATEKLVSIKCSLHIKNTNFYFSTNKKMCLLFIVSYWFTLSLSAFTLICRKQESAMRNIIHSDFCQCKEVYKKVICETSFVHFSFTSTFYLCYFIYYMVINNRFSLPRLKTSLNFLMKINIHITTLHQNFPL